MSAGKVQLIRLEPENITFNMVEKEPTVVLKIHNTSEKMVAFKVKTTHPKRYLVRPNQDVIPVGGTSSVKINLQIKDAKQLRQERISGMQTLDKDCKDNKFLVQCAVVKDKFLEDIEELHLKGATKEIGGMLKEMWGGMTRDEFVNKKLTCLFEYPEDVGLLMEVNDVGGSSVPFSPEPSHDLTGDATDSDSLVDLRKKYNELINFTVQLTAERDRFKANLKDASKEIQLLKKGQSSSGHASKGSYSGDDEGDTWSSSRDITSGVFSLGQVMLIAVVAFLMGRLMMVM